MSVVNWIVQKSMVGEAKRIAKWARKTYDEVKEANRLSDKDIHIMMVGDKDKLDSLKAETRQYIETCCQTIEGLCYMMAMDFGNLKGSMNFRLLQFTKYMDYYLYSLGFNPQTKEQKEDVLKALKIYSKDWEEYTK